MLAALIIVFREIIEAGIVVGIVLAATRHVARRGLWVAYGIGAGALGACIVALFAQTISNALSGFGQEYFNVGILTVAVGMLTWHNVWMARHGREMAMEMKAIGEAVAHGQRTLMALAVVVGIAVLREGSEIVLFLYGIAISGTDSAFSMIMGGLLGLVMGVSVAAVTYLGLLHIPNRHLFRVTGWMLALLSAGMASQAVAFLEQAQVVNALAQTAWNSSWLLSEGSLMGKAMHTLVGYSERPTVMQVIVYSVTLAVTFLLMKLFGHSTPHHPKQHAMHAA